MANVSGAACVQFRHPMHTLSSTNTARCSSGGPLQALTGRLVNVPPVSSRKRRTSSTYSRCDVSFISTEYAAFSRIATSFAELPAAHDPRPPPNPHATLTSTRTKVGGGACGRRTAAQNESGPHRYLGVPHAEVCGRRL
jgi:hypothetical protein